MIAFVAMPSTWVHMNTLRSSGDESQRELWWTRYLQVLAAQKVPQKQLAWHRIHIERLLDAVPGVRASLLSATDVQRYCDQHLLNAQTDDWQREQALSAIRRFGRHIGAAWARDIDWHALQARLLPNSHMNAQEVIQASSQGDLPDCPDLRAFAMAMRVRRYRLKTEKSYLKYVQRCATWCRVEQPAHLSPGVWRK